MLPELELEFPQAITHHHSNRAGRSAWAMKCQNCDKTATFHITELMGGDPVELHLCEECARDYLHENDEDNSGVSSIAGALAQQLAGGSSEDLSRLDKKACPICGISFYEFRNEGRFGCPHDYVCFEEELEPLLLNIHGETQHVGKHPKTSPLSEDVQTELIQLRSDMKDAVKKEEYERASQLRDRIRELQGQAKGNPGED